MLSGHSLAAEAVNYQRIVSLNLCTDIPLLLLAPERTQAVSFIAKDTRYSPVAELAAGVATHDGQLEQIVALEPDLIVGVEGYNRQLVSRLQQLGLPINMLSLPTELEQVPDFMQQFAQLLGSDYVQAPITPIASDGKTALVLEPNGYSYGDASLKGQLVTAAGLQNQASEYGIEYSGQLSLEQIGQIEADYLITHEGNQAPALANRWVSHPALAQKQWQVIEVPSNLWICPSPFLQDALDLIEQGSAQ